MKRFRISYLAENLGTIWITVTEESTMIQLHENGTDLIIDLYEIQNTITDVDTYYNQKKIRLYNMNISETYRLMGYYVLDAKTLKLQDMTDDPKPVLSFRQ